MVRKKEAKTMKCEPKLRPRIFWEAENEANIYETKNEASKTEYCTSLNSPKIYVKTIWITNSVN